MKKIFLLAAAALALAACDSNNDTPDNSQTAAQITATIGESTITRVSDDNWGNGDKIGISSTVGAVGGPYVNLEYTTTKGDGTFTGTSMFFYKPMTLTAYYPFSGKEGTAPGIIEAETNAKDQENLPDIDFLWDQQTGFTASDPKVNFNFAHKMSKVTFTFLSSDPVENISDGVDVATMVRYEIGEEIEGKKEGLVLKGTFNPSTGVCTATGTPEILTMSAQGKVEELKTDDASDSQKKKPLNQRTEPSIILFPQKLSGGNVILHIYTDELST